MQTVVIISIRKISNTKVNSNLIFDGKKMINLRICKPYLIYLNHGLYGIETCINVVITHLLEF